MGSPLRGLPKFALRPHRSLDALSTLIDLVPVLVTYALIWGSWILFGIVVAWALAWAVRTGQFSHVREASESIFDDEEPIGLETDRFPDLPPRGGDVSRPRREDTPR